MRRAGRMRLVDGELDVPAPGDLAERGEQLAPHLVASRVVGRSEVEAEVGLSGDDVHPARIRSDPAHRRDDVCRTGDPLDGDDHLARRDERVASSAEWRPRMPRDAGHRDREAPRPADRRDDGERPVGLEQHRPLLDVRLEIADEVVGASRRLADAGRVEPEGPEGLVEADARGVDVRPPVLIPGPRDRARAEERGAEPRPLLVPERYDLDRDRQPLAASMQAAHDGDPEEHAEDAVVAAGVRHGVEVRAEDERRRARRRALVAAPLVPRGVLPGRHARLVHPPGGHRVHRRVLGREVDAADAGRGRADPCKLLATGQDLGGVDSHAAPASAYTSRAAPTPPPAVTGAPSWRRTARARRAS